MLSFESSLTNDFQCAALSFSGGRTAVEMELEVTSEHEDFQELPLSSLSGKLHLIHFTCLR